MRRRAYVLTCLLASTACATAPQNALAASYFAISDVTVDEGAGAAQFLIRRVAGVNQRAVVRVSTRNGTAIAGSDYVTREETLTFLPGERSKPLSVTIIDDSRKEVTENFTVTVRPVSNARLYDDGAAFGRITDIDDQVINAPPPVVCPDGSTTLPCPGPVSPPSLSIDDVTIAEGATSIPITIRKHGTLNNLPSTFTLFTINGTATAPGDYAQQQVTLEMAAGVNSRQIDIPLVDDIVPEPTEHMTVQIQAGTNARLYDGTALVTITDADVAPPPPPPPPPVVAPTVTLDARNCAEGVGNCTVYVWRTGDITATSTLTWATTGGGTATAGSDYTASTGTVSFVPGMQNSSFLLPITDDATDESDETITVSLTAVNNATVGTVGALTIVDDDLPVPPPPPPGKDQNEVTVEGDSISVFGAGHYPNLYDASRSGVTICQIAVSASDIEAVTARLPSARNCNSEVVTLLIGANDMYNGNLAVTEGMWLNKVWAYTDQLRSEGFKVAMGTVLPQNINGSAYMTEFKRRRPIVNQAIRSAVGTHIDAVIDFAADSRFGDDADALNTALYPDGLHPSGTTHGYMAEVYTPVVDALLAQGTSTPSTQVDIASPSLNGLALNVPHDYNLDLQSGQPIPVDGGSDPQGSYRQICGDGFLRKMDPILYPGQEVAGHLHDFSGDKLVDDDSTEQTLLGTGESTCNDQPGTGRASQNAVYWIAALLDGVGNVVRPDYNSVYYKRIPANNAACGNPLPNNTKQGICIPFPNGLRMISGSLLQAGKFGPLNYRTDGGRPVYFGCHGTGAVGGRFATLAGAYAASPVCPNLQIVVEFPTCWDGQNLWKVDRSHIVYARYNNFGVYQCPTTNPYMIPSVTIHYEYRTDANWKTYTLACDAMDPTQPRGWCLHADAWLVWDERVKQEMEAGCINNHLNCSGGDLGSGRRLKGAGQPVYGFTNPNRLTPISSLPVADRPDHTGH